MGSRRQTLSLIAPFVTIVARTVGSSADTYSVRPALPYSLLMILGLAPVALSVPVKISPIPIQIALSNPSTSRGRLTNCINGKSTTLLLF
jgi:hypothetical protein